MQSDVCVIGAGMAGGLIAYELARRGIRVTIIEAGPRHDPAQRFDYMLEAIANGDPWAPNVPQRDVFTNSGPVEYPLNGMRVKAVGGSTLHWGGLTLRLHESDFRMRTLYGVADDWPISYDDLEPYYGKAEWELNVAGTADNPFASPRSTEYPFPAFPFSHSDAIFHTACEKLGIRAHHIPFARNREPSRGRPGCQAFATCGPKRVCPIRAQYTAESHVDFALETGHAQLLDNANVMSINAGANGQIESLTVARPDGSRFELRATIYVVAAHAVESARLLLMSRSERFPNGLANRSGNVGRYFMEHLSIKVNGRMKERTWPFRIGFHTSESHQFLNPANRDELSGIKLAFLNNPDPEPSSIAAQSGAWGDRLAEEIRNAFGYSMQLSATVEQLPDADNRITLNPDVKDLFGNPVPNIHYSVGEYERRSLKAAEAHLQRIMDAVGASDVEAEAGFSYDAHHLGTCRMGNDPETSVVNADLRTHDVDNLYVVGSSVFTTGGVLQPTLTIAALAIRAGEHIAGVLRR